MAVAAARMRYVTHRPSRESWTDIAEWYERYQEPLLGYAAQLTRSLHDAEDIAQEAFVHLWFARSSGPIHNPKAFLFATASNLVKDKCRLAHTQAMRAAVPVEDVEIPDLSDPSQAVESDEALALILSTLQHLRPCTQKAFFLDRVELCSHAQIAARMGVTVSMVEKHISYAMTALEGSGFEQPRHAGGLRRKRGARKPRRGFQPQPLRLSA
jgi:RNA polymerase sigma-70 factor (ECF subfamily)